MCLHAGRLGVCAAGGRDGALNHVVCMRIPGLEWWCGQPLAWWLPLWMLHSGQLVLALVLVLQRHCSWLALLHSHCSWQRLQ